VYSVFVVIIFVDLFRFLRVALVLEYDLIEDLKKLRANIYVFELLKFPLIL
jgi:hypothetical protein